MTRVFVRMSIVILSSLAANLAAAKVARPQQFVMLAFDGSKNVQFWKDSRAFAAETNLRFTYFANGVYFLPDKSKSNYVEPSKGTGKSAIGFGGDNASIQLRLDQMIAAMDEGHEMASHGNGHYDGSAYTATQWNKEFTQFVKLMSNAYANSGSKNEPTWWKAYWSNTLSNDWGNVGFRAPQLGVGNGLWSSLQTNGYLYDTSRVDKMSYWPRVINNVWNFPLAGLTIAGTTKKTLSMDYNFYVGQSKGVDGPASEHKKYEDQMYNTYIGYFNSNYYGNRAPVHIGHHFSLWNGGAYWKAMKRFAADVCAKPEVVCGTYKELLAFMEENKNNVDALQKGDFDKMPVPANLSINLSNGVRELNDQDLEDLRSTLPNHFQTHDEDSH